MDVTLIFKDVFIDKDDEIRGDAIITHRVELGENITGTWENIAKALTYLVPVYVDVYQKEPDHVEIG
jgi:hypothetical protein